MTPRKSYEQMERDFQGVFDRYTHDNGFAAFSNDQAEDGLRRFGLKFPEGMKKFTSIGGGMYVLTPKVAELEKMCAAHYNEIERCMADDDWLRDAFAYEIANHDANWCEWPDEFVENFGLKFDQVKADPRLKRIFDEAYDQALGIDIEETEDNSYYILCRRTDPTYTAETAIKEWLSENKDVAIGLAQQYWSENDPDSEPFDWDYFEELLQSMGPIEAFRAGCFSDINWSDNYVVIDGYGNFETISDSEFEDRCYSLVHESDFIEKILDGTLEIPPDMAEIIGIFTFDKDKLTVSQCKRSRHAITSKSRKTARTTSTVRKTKALAMKVQPRKKTFSRNKSKPTVSNGKRARMTKTNHFKGGVVTTRKDKIAKQKPKTKTATNRSRGARQ